MKNKLILSILLLAFTVGFSSCSARVKEYKLQIVKTMPHDVKAYTQGLFFHEGVLYESTGQFGQSSFRKLDLESGEVLEKIKFNDKYFGEGSVILGDKLFILTWYNKVAFVYDAKTLKYQKTYSYPREGWGLTTDGKQLIASDGSSRIYFLDSEFRQERVIDVKMNGRPLRYLNELEWIDGKIWANVYMTDMIVIINPKTAEVEGVVDCSGILPESERTPDTDVLNGIAYDPMTKKIYLTGKNWPKLYEVKLIEK